MNELTGKIQTEIKKVIVGKDDVVRRVLMAILAQGHVLLEDVPGVGKTALAMAFAKTLGLKTARVQFTSDTMPSDIIGFSVYDKDTGKLSYKPGAVMTNLLLADEINRTSSKTQSALLEAMEEKNVTVDGVTVSSYTTRTERTGWGWWSPKVTYRVFTYTATAPAQTTDYAVCAVNAEGTASEPITATLTVRPATWWNWWF